MGRNPATGEAIKIKASKKVAFAPPRTSRSRSDRQAFVGFKDKACQAREAVRWPGLS